ncbi:MAG: hypothetical protein AAB384_01135 [Patescibacteria group bacterium]
MRRTFCIAHPIELSEDPIPVLMTEPNSPCGVVRPLWLWPDHDEYFLYHIDDDSLEQLVHYIRVQTHVDEYARILAPYYDSITRFLRDMQVRIDRAAIIDELHKHPELMPALAGIFATREVLRRKSLPSA